MEPVLRLDAVLRAFATSARGLCVLATCCVAAGACASSRDGADRAAPSTTTRQPATTSTQRAGSAPPSTAVDPAASPATTPRFDSSIAPVPDAVRRRMDGVSMRAGCPVGYDRLRYLMLSHWDFDGGVSVGELVVHEDVAADVVSVFRDLFDAGFAIRRMVLVDDFGPAADPRDGADDFASIEADNTSAFNCRVRTGSESTFSEHSYGTAIDLNPIENPYVTSTGTTSHSASRAFLDRTTGAPGMIRADGPVVAAFEEIGWGWGGTWTDVLDYQHFSRSGR